MVNYCFSCKFREQCNDKADRIGATSGVWGGKRRK